MSEEIIYVETTPDIEEWLAENHLSVADLVRETGLSPQIKYGERPYDLQEGTQSRDIVTILAVGSLFVLALATAISHVLETLYKRPVLVEICEIQAVQDDSGNVLQDIFGNPILQSVKRYELVEPKSLERETTIEVSAGISNGLVFKFKTISDNSTPIES